MSGFMFGEVLHTLEDLAATLASVLVCGHTLPHDEGRKRRPDAPRRDLRCISLQILEQISLRHQMTLGRGPAWSGRAPGRATMASRSI